MNLYSIKIITAVLISVLAFNFFHSEIIDQFEENKKCKEVDYCKLVQAASIKTSSFENKTDEDFILIDFISPGCLKIELSKELYGEHRNNSFNHLEVPAVYLLKQSFLI